MTNLRGIFLSYRRSDSGYVDRLEGLLKVEFPTYDVFRDTGGIAPGEEYVKTLQVHVDHDPAFLAIIGPEWCGRGGLFRRRRIDDPDDVLRREVARRLDNHGWLLPVLVGGATMPGKAELPLDLHDLAERNALTVSAQDLEGGAPSLMLAVTPILRQHAEKVRREAEKDARFERTMDESEARRRASGAAPPPAHIDKPNFRFSLDGKWRLDVIASDGRASIEFEAAPTKKDPTRPISTHKIDGTMQAGGQSMRIHGDAGVLSVLDGSSVLHLNWINDDGDSATIDVPLKKKIGEVYHGTGGRGERYVLRLLKAKKFRSGL